MRVTESTSDSRFDVQGPLGSGGMGTVYRAYDPRLGRDIALKMLRQVTGRDLYRFKREFRSLADIVHPNLVSLHELHTTGGQWFFTMELVEGVTFATWVRPERGPLDEARLRAALPQLVEGVLALHVGGKLHRDLKPSNVLVTRDGRVVLLDFGLISDVAAGAAEHTHEAMAVGTPAYMSPEQAADLPLTEASDWYAVGVMLYEALTGKRPFEGAPEALMHRKQVEAPVPPAVVDAAAPADLSRLCVAMLARDPAARPDGRAILEALGQAPSMALTTLERVAVARPFIGRTGELAALRAAVADARTRTVAVYVTGESGIGKSQLVRRLLDEVSGEATVLEGRCYERESVPYKTLDTVVDAVTGVLLGLSTERARAVVPPDVAALARLFPVLKRVPVVAERSVVAALPPPGPELRARAFGALRALLARLASDAPLIIAIDDLQWGDLDSAVFLGELVHLPDPVPLLLILIHRPEDDAGVVARIRAELPGLGAGDQRSVAVGPLPDEEARQLLLAVGAGSATRETVIREAGGHPLFLAELARTARHRGADTATLEELIGRRIAALPESAANLLRAAAVAARPVPFELAVAAAGLSRVGTELQLLRAERLIRVRHVADAAGTGDVDGEHIEPYHDRIRQAAVASLDAKPLRAMHEALARAYEARGTGGDREILVAHWLAAGQLVRASEYAAEAAAAAEAALAFHRAAQLYSLAIEHGVHDAPARRALHRRRGDALASAGRLMEAAAEYAAAARGAADDDAMELDRLRLEALLRHGAMEEGLELSRRLLGQIGVELPESRPATIRAIVRQMVRARLRGLRWTERAEADVPADVLRRVDLLFSSSSSVSLINPLLGRLCQGHLLRAALDAGEPRRICLALSLELAYLGQVGPRAQRKIDRVTALVRPLAARVDSHYARGVAACMEGYVNFMLGRWSDARALLEDGLRTLREHGSGGRWEMNVCDQVLLTALFYLGDAREAGRLVPRLVREAMERGDSYAQDGLRAWRGHPAWLLMGRLEDARAHVAAVEDASPAPGTIQVRHFHELIARVNIALYEGDGAAAQAHLEAGWPAIASSGLLRVQVLRIESALLRGRAALACGAVGDEGRRPMAAQVRTLAREVEREGGWGAPIGKLLRGGASALVGDRDAMALFEEAERGFTAHHMGLFADVARLRRSQLEGGAAGAARAAAARESMRDRGVADVDAITRMLCPMAPPVA